MRRLLVAILLLTACSPAPTPGAASAIRSDMRTIDDADARPKIIDPPPVLTDEAPPPRPKNPFDAEKLVPLTPADEKIRAGLPFTPAIAMDPVDGSKVSIRASTPMFEYKNRIYYFSSEANKRAFAAAPEQFTKGAFSQL